MFSMCSATMKLKNFLSHLLSKKEKRKEPALSRLFFWFNATRTGCNQQNQQICCSITQFQSNATRAGCNVKRSKSENRCNYFNLTQPVWVATICTQFQNCCFVFQSNATRVGCNNQGISCCNHQHIFQSNATRVGCNSKLAQMKQRVVMHFVQCLSAFWLYIIVRYHLL